MPLYNLRWKSLPQYSLSCRGVEVGRFTDTLQASVTKGTESIYSQASIKRCPYKQNKCAHATTGNPLTPNTYHLTPILPPLLKKSTLFTSHLHFPLFRSIFFQQRERHRVPFFDYQSTNGFSPLLWRGHSAQMALQKSPNELPTVLLLHRRLGLVRILMGRKGQIRQVKSADMTGARKIHVSLFLKF